MNEKLPSPCDDCTATGLFQGAGCEQCGGKGYRLIINGQPAPTKGEWPARRFQPKHLNIDDRLPPVGPIRFRRNLRSIQINLSAIRSTSFALSAQIASQ